VLAKFFDGNFLDAAQVDVGVSRQENTIINQ
jgi:hypothetical protein